MAYAEGYDRYPSSRSILPDPYGNGYPRDSYSSPPSSRGRGEESWGPKLDSFGRPDMRGVGVEKEDVVHSRLFVVHGAPTTKEELTTAFEQFGTVESVRLVKRREGKATITAISFVKYSKASEAAMAITQLDGQVLEGSPKPLKVMVATSYGTGKEAVPEDELTRLFIRIPEEFTEDDVHHHFGQFGGIEFVNMVMDKETGKHKGIAFVRFFKFYDAAKALEEVDPSFKAKFAGPRADKRGPKGGAPPLLPPMPSVGGAGGGFLPDLMGMQYPPTNTSPEVMSLLPEEVLNPPHDPEASTKLRLLVDKNVDERNLTFLCEVIPGFRRCDMTSPGVAIIVFDSVNWAQWGHRKLNGLEYPIGNRMIAKFIPDPDGAVAPVGAAPAKSGDIPYYPVSVELPDRQRMVPKKGAATPYKKRLFVKSSPRALPRPVLEDAFCRFGNLFDVYILPGKTCGYAKFDSVESADEARNTLHGAELAGCRMTVVDAEEEKEGGSDAKRRKT